MEQSAQRSLPLEEVRDLVRGRYGERAGVPAPLSAGEWSRAYSMTLDGADVVLRLGAHGEDFEKDRIASGLARSGLPVPRVLECGPLAGRHHAVSERAHGTALDDLTGAEMALVLPSLLDILDLVSLIDVGHTTGYGMWSPAQHAPYAGWADALLAIAVETPRVPGWRAALERSDVGLGPFDAGLAALAASAPRLPTGRHLVHGDLLSGNVLAADGVVTAVLDWGNSLYGDHLYDAAWLIYWWPWYPRWSGIDIRSRLFDHWRATGRVPDNAEERLRAYLLHIGLDAMAYCAFRSRWHDVRRNAETVRELARGDGRV